MTYAVSALIASLCCVVAATQRTYQRQCECEFQLDGRCAYTLLLPKGIQDGGGSCPSSGPSSSSSADMTQVKQELAKIRQWQSDQVAKVSEWQSDQVAKMSGLSSQVNKLLPLINQQPNHPPAPPGSPGTSLPTPINLNAMQMQLTNLSKLVNALTKNSGSGSGGGGDGTELRAEWTKTKAEISNQLESLQTVNAAIGRLQRSHARLCANRALIVSGPNASLPDQSITASSIFDSRHGSERARINYKGANGSPGSWCAREPKKIGQDWLQFTLDRARPVYSIVTRGRQDYEQYVMRYKVSYSNDNVGWTFVKDLLGRDLEFEGNNDKDSLKVNDLWQPIVARHVRIYPLKSFEDGNFCMRADIVSCLDN